MGFKANLEKMDIVREMTLSTFMVALFGSLGGIGFGVDFGFWSGLLGMQQFKNDFGVYDPATDTYMFPSSWLSAGSGPPTAGLAVGALLSGLLGNRLGRLNAFRLSSIVSLVGILVQATAMTSYWQIVVGRIINGLALGILANTTPAYLAEVSPLSIRGTIVNFYQFSIGVGAVLVNTANWGMHARQDQWAYRLSIILQFLIPIVFIPGSYFVPESPRWLIGKGRDAEALKALGVLRTNTSRDVLAQEVQLIVAQEEENKQTFGGTWADCFTGTNRRRTLIATGVQCLQQAQGSSFMSSYAVIFFQTLGIKDEYKIIVLLLMVQTLASAFAFYLPDRLGRRLILISMAILMGLCMLVVSIVMGFDFANNDHGLQAATACVFIWQFATSVGWSSCVWIVTAEVPTLQLREKTITVATFSGFCVSILITFVSPFMQDADYGNLGARIGFVWGGFSVIAALWTFFYLPETGSRSLEELDELFLAGVSVWKFRKYQTSGFGAQQAEVEHGEPGRALEAKQVVEAKQVEEQ